MKVVYWVGLVWAAALAYSQLPAGPSRLAEWTTATPASVNMDEDLLRQARDYALRGGGSGMIIRHGKLVYQWGDLQRRYDLKSSTKSIGMTAVGLAIADGKLLLSDPASKHHSQFGVPPEENRQTGWLDQITLFHLASQTAGFDKNGGYTKLMFRPGTQWAYSDGGPNWLAECVTLAYRRDLQDLLFERVFSHLGIDRDDLVWRNNAYRPHEIDGIPRREFGSGIHANVDAMARIGYLWLNQGRLGRNQILPADFVNTARSPQPSVEGLPVVKPEQYGRASNHYGLLWWNNHDGTMAGVPRDAYWSWGLYESVIFVVPSLDLVAVRAGKSLPDAPTHFGRLEPFLRPIAESVGRLQSGRKAPYPPSPVIEALEWAPASEIYRAANGSDNWPATWGDDDALYTAYGDGWGFDPKVPKKLSLGLARITGPPSAPRGENIRSATAEREGQGKDGLKASGMLMVDGVLYMLVRNAGNSTLAWSADRGKTWTWADWKFETSMGNPAFLNFGKNYGGARDGFVYVYSPDNASAYEPSDGLILARVPKDRIRDRNAYEFFGGTAAKPAWTADIKSRRPVFEHKPLGVYRTHVSYNAPLRRYIMTAILPGEAPRFKGGFGVYDAPEPWGPWTTVSFTELWDVGPGEQQSFPPKWMSADGLTMHLLFSGEDMFSVRRARVKLR